MSAPTEQTYRRFLLGIASEDDLCLAEESILAGEVDASTLHEIEDGLIDDYLLGNFTPEESNGFTARFLTVEERRQRFAFASALVEYARKRQGRQPWPERRRVQGSGTITALVWRRAALLATAATVVLAAALGLQHIKLRDQMEIASETRNEVTRLRSALSTGNSAAPQPVAIAPESHKNPHSEADRMPAIEFGPPTRGIQSPLLLIPAKAQFVRIDLKLSLPLANWYRESVSVPGGGPLWTQEFPVSVLPATRQSSIVLPASILSHGPYHLQVEKALVKDQFGPPEDYVFIVEKQ